VRDWNKITIFSLNGVFQILLIIAYFLNIQKLSLDDIGFVSNIIAYTALVGILIRFGGNESLFKFADHKKLLLKQYSISTLAAFIIWCLSILPLYFIAIKNNGDNLVFTLIVILCLFQPISNIVEQKLYIQGEYNKIIKLLILKILIILLFIYIVYILGGSIYGLIFINICSNLAILFIRVNWGIAKNDLEKYLKNSWIFFLLSLIYLMPITLDRLYINNLIGEEQLGIYDIAYKCGIIIDLLILTPIFNLVLNKVNHKNVLYYVFSLSVLLVTFFYIFSFQLYHHINESLKYFNKYNVIEFEVLNLIIGITSISFINNLLKIPLLKTNLQKMIFKINLINLIIIIFLVLIVKVSSLIILMNMIILYHILNFIGYIFTLKRIKYNVWN